MTKSIIHPDYPAFFASIKDRVLLARTAAAKAVNRELVLLYWDIGRGIVEKQKLAGWGDAVVERLASDLQSEFRDSRGFSTSALWRMRQFYESYSDPAFVEAFAREEKADRHVSDKAIFLAQAVREMIAHVPWGHHVLLLGRIEAPAARLYYLRATAQFGWSRAVLLNQIKAGAYERAKLEKKTHNFPLALPEYLAEQADEMMKSRYNLEFLGIRQPMKERELEDRLIGRLQQFILELGYGFCFVGRQYRLELGGDEFFVDLLFYHRFLKALVAFDLKVVPFQPEHAGKMDFYLNVLNEKERGPGDQPSIGIVLCAEKNDLVVEYALKTKANPIGVAAYLLQTKLPAEFKGRLPTARQLAEALLPIKQL